MSHQTPMMQQYLRCKAEHPDALLFFRLGDFYEMFGDDAILCARELELTLTSRTSGAAGQKERTPMCGVPWHALDGYVQKLLQKGFRVAIAEQTTDPAESKGLVDREIIRVISPGTVVDDALLEEKSHNYIACVHIEEAEAGLCVADVSTGHITAAQLPCGKLYLELMRVMPKELLASPWAMDLIADMSLGEHISVVKQEEKPFTYEVARGELALRFGEIGYAEIRDMPLAIQAAGAMMDFLRQTQKRAVQHLREVKPYIFDKLMAIDATARRNLELVQNLRGRGRKGTLLSVLDNTSTAMGGRLIKEWIERPLCSIEGITARQAAVEELVQGDLHAQEMRELLSGINDLERTCTRLSYMSFDARDALALSRSLERLPKLRRLAEQTSCEALMHISRRIDALEDLCTLVEGAISERPPVGIKEGGLFREGYIAELDALRNAATNGKAWIATLEEREREETGIKNLKISFNRVFGYYIEVTRSYLEKVPYRYTRKQTLAGCERFITEELKAMEEDVLGAEERATRLEYILFTELRDKLVAGISRIQHTAQAVAELDCCLSLARAAILRGYRKPTITAKRTLSVKRGRHPVVEAAMEAGFVPNDITFSNEERLIVLTGPNMSGKSTAMRQVALIVLMAHIGSFVPADEAVIPLTDRIFTRIGAQDDLSAGQSTFMLEMTEVSDILREATANSLIILDEVGRGTSTFDGLSIAWALVEHIADMNKVGAFTLFATHYHELAELEGRLSGVANYRVTVREHENGIVFLYTLERGGADKSFGIQVAALAGVPLTVLNRAREVLARLEASELSGASVGQRILEKGKKPAKQQMDLLTVQRDELLEDLRNLDVTTITPIDAMNKLFFLRERARRT